MATSTSTQIDYCKIPLQVTPPPGQSHNFVNPPTRAPQIYQTAAVCIPLILIFGGLRLYSKLIIKKVRTWDDLCFIFAMVISLFYIAGTVAAVANKPYGLHQWDIFICQFSSTEVILTLTLNAVYSICVWLVKCSLFILYLTLFGILRWMRISVYIGIAFTGIVYLLHTATFLAFCSPHKSHPTDIDYLMALDSKTCIAMDQVSVALGAFNVFTDLYLLVLPMIAIWKMNLTLGKKARVSSVFLTGVAASVASCLGLYYRVEQNLLGDRTWSAISAWLTAFVELTAGLMVCCMPALTVVFTHWLKPLVTFLSKSRYGRAIMTSTGLDHVSTATVGRRRERSPRVGEDTLGLSGLDEEFGEQGHNLSLKSQVESSVRSGSVSLGREGEMREMERNV